MRFFVPILSLIGLVVVFIWAVSSGQLSKLSVADELSSLTVSMPYLLLVILAAQVAIVYQQMRPRLSALKMVAQDAPGRSADTVDSAAVDMGVTPYAPT